MYRLGSWYCKLRKSVLHGSKQASRQWHTKVRRYNITAVRFHENAAHRSIRWKINRNKFVILVPVYYSWEWHLDLVRSISTTEKASSASCNIRREPSASVLGTWRILHAACERADTIALQLGWLPWSQGDSRNPHYRWKKNCRHELMNEIRFHEKKTTCYGNWLELCPENESSGRVEFNTYFS